MNKNLIFLVATSIFFVINTGEDLQVVRKNEKPREEEINPVAWRPFLRNVLCSNLEYLREEYIKLHEKFDRVHWDFLSLEDKVLNSADRAARFKISYFERALLPTMESMEYFDRRKRRTCLDPVSVDTNLHNAQYFLKFQKEKIDGINVTTREIFSRIKIMKDTIKKLNFCSPQQSGMQSVTQKKYGKRKNKTPDVREKNYKFQRCPQNYIVTNMRNVYGGLFDIAQCYEFYRKRCEVFTKRYERLWKKLNEIEDKERENHRQIIISQKN